MGNQQNAEEPQYVINEVAGINLCLPIGEVELLENCLGRIKKRELIRGEPCVEIQKGNTLFETKVDMKSSYKIFLTNLLSNQRREVVKTNKSGEMYYLENKGKGIPPLLITNLYDDIVYNEKERSAVVNDLLYNIPDKVEYKNTPILLKVIENYNDGNAHIFLVLFNRTIFNSETGKVLSPAKIQFIDTAPTNIDSPISINISRFINSIDHIQLREPVITSLKTDINFQEHDEKTGSDGYCAVWTLYFIWKFIVKGVPFFNIYQELFSIQSKKYTHIYQHLILLFYGKHVRVTRSNRPFGGATVGQPPAKKSKVSKVSPKKKTSSTKKVSPKKKTSSKKKV
jgi:hypothetical protein